MTIIVIQIENAKLVKIIFSVLKIAPLVLRMVFVVALLMAYAIPTVKKLANPDCQAPAPTKKGE
jgi:hypothetical protein